MAEEIRGMSDDVKIQPLVVMTSSEDIEKRFTKIDNYSIAILDAINKFKITDNSSIVEIIKQEINDLRQLGDSRYKSIENMLLKLMEQYSKGQGSSSIKDQVIHAINKEDFDALSRMVREIMQRCESLTEYEKTDDIEQHKKLDKIIELLMSKNLIQKESKVPISDKNFLDRLSVYVREWQQIPIDIATKTFEQVRGVAEKVGGLIISTSEDEKKRDEDEKKEIDKINRKLDSMMEMIANLKECSKRDQSTTVVEPIRPPVASYQEPKPNPTSITPPIKQDKDNVITDNTTKLEVQKEIQKERTLSEGIEINEVKKYIEFKGHSDNQDNSFFKINTDKALHYYNNSDKTTSIVNAFYSIKKADDDVKAITSKFKTLESGTGSISILGEQSMMIAPMRKKELQELITFHLLTVNDMRGTMKFSDTINRLCSATVLNQTFPSIAQLNDIRSSYIIDSLGESNNNYMNSVLKIINSQHAFTDPNSLVVPFRNLGLRGMFNQATMDYGKNMKLFAVDSPFAHEYEYYLSMLMFFKFINPYTSFDTLEAFRSLWSLDLDYNNRKQVELNNLDWIKGGMYPILGSGTLSAWEYGIPPRTQNFSHLKDNMKENRGQKGYTPWTNASIWPVTDKNMLKLNTATIGAKNDHVGAIIEVLGSKIDYKQQSWLGDLKKFTGIARVTNIKERLSQIMCGLAAHYYTCKRVKLSDVFNTQKVAVDEVAHNLEGKLYEVQMILFNNESPKDLLLPRPLPSIGSKKIVA